MDWSTAPRNALFLLGCVCYLLSICAENPGAKTKPVKHQDAKSIQVDTNHLPSQLHSGTRVNGDHSSATTVITSWGLGHPSVFYVEDLLQINKGTAFYDPRIGNYSHLIILPQQSVLYTVANGATILKLDLDTFFMLDSYTVPQPQNRHPSCQDEFTCREATEVSLLTLMPNEQMIWFCYVHQFQYLNRSPQHLHTGCVVPEVDDLSKPLIQWEDQQFGSLDPQQPAKLLNARDNFTYIAGVTPNYLRIFRTHMPDWNGRLNWSGALVTDRSQDYIAEPAAVLLSFEWDNEVYFVLKEQQIHSTAQTRNGRWSARLGRRNDRPVVNVETAARLVRICKGDRGGLPHVSADKFATFAKADLLCQASDEEGNYFSYTQVTSAFWDNSTQRLYAAFKSEKWAPVGGALCVYPKANIESAFNGPLYPANRVGLSRTLLPVPNSFPNVCERFNSANLTETELFIGRRIALSFPNRYNPITPLYHRAVLIQTGVDWIHLQAYDLPPLPIHYHFGNPVRTTVVWLGTRNFLTRLSIYEDGIAQVVCRLNEIHTGQALSLLTQTVQGGQHTEGWSIDTDPAEEILEMKLTHDKLFVVTNRQLLWIPLTDCSRHKTYDDCMESKDPHCGWSWPDGQCVNGYTDPTNSRSSWYNTYSPSVNRRRPSLEHCPIGKQPVSQEAGAWSEWYSCRWFDTATYPAVVLEHEELDKSGSYAPVLGKCLCRICLRPTQCITGSQEVANCTRFENGWFQWSPWSPCDLRMGVQTRHRSCPSNIVCSGSSRDHRPCPTSSSYWFQPIDIAAVNKEGSSKHVLKQALLQTHQSNDGVSLTLLFVVAFCCLFVGAFVPTVIFYLLPFPCTRSDKTNHEKSLTDYHQSCCCCCNGYSRNYDESRSVYIRTEQEKAWRIDATNPEKQLFINHGSHEDRCCSKTQSTKRPSGISQNFLKPPSLSSRQLLVFGTPLPSPTSVTSNPSTVSTLVKEKFVFDTMSDVSYETHAQNTLKSMTIPVEYSKGESSQAQDICESSSAIRSRTSSNELVTPDSAPELITVIRTELPVSPPVQISPIFLATWKIPCQPDNNRT